MDDTPATPETAPAPDVRPLKRPMRRKPPKAIERYGTRWRGDLSDIQIEIESIRRGGNWISPSGNPAGIGLAAHYKNLDRLLWPEDVWDEWDDWINREACLGGVLGCAGPSSSGKSHGLVKFALKVFRCFPDNTTILVSSTTLPALDRKIWGELVSYWNSARDRDPEFPGVYTESRREITPDGREIEGRDRRNGIKGIPCRQGQRWVGLGDYVGTKNEHVVLISDEAPMMSPTFYDAIGNLRSNPWWFVGASGNAHDPLDAFGKLCEPKDGWDQLVQGDKSQTWRTRDPQGRVIRFDGLDCPNLKAGPGKEPCRRKMTWRYVKEMRATYGEGSWQWETWVRSRFMVNVMEKRLFVRKFCEKFRAFSDPEWTEGSLTRLVSLDAAFGAVGGDRCIAMDWAFGESGDMAASKEAFTVGIGSNGEIRLGANTKKRLALLKTYLVPVDATKPLLPAYQIAEWAKNHCEELGIPPSHFFFDASMRGELVSAIMQTWSTAVVAIDFGGQATDRPDPENPSQKCSDAYWQFVTELNFSLRAIIRADQFRGMTLDIVREAEMRSWDQVAHGNSKRVQIEPKKKMKERVNWSPDLCDCAACGVEGARRLGFQIGQLGIERRRASGPNELDKAAEKWKEAQKKHELVA